jgi:hypothetical protein
MRFRITPVAHLISGRGLELIGCELIRNELKGILSLLPLNLKYSLHFLS